MRKLFLRWPALTLAFFLAGSLCLPSAGGALLDSQTSRSVNAPASALKPENEMTRAYLASIGWSREKIEEKFSYLSEAEIQELALSSERVIAGGGEQERKAAGVAIAIIITVGLITGIYLFANR